MNILNPSQVSNSPLFSCIATLYTLILLYFPSTLITTLSPILILTSLLLLLLLRLGSSSHKQTQLQPPLQKQEEDEKLGGYIDDKCQALKSATEEREEWNVGASFLGWDVGGPLEVIYEDHHEGGESDGESNHLGPTGSGSGSGLGLERYPSLAMYFPETDSGSSLDDEGCEWEEEDRDGLLIEIPLNLDYCMKESNPNPDPDPVIGLDSCVEEDNFIEIDVFLGKV